MYIHVHGHPDLNPSYTVVIPVFIPIPVFIVADLVKILQHEIIRL